MALRLVHYSDVHVTQSPLDEGPLALLSKRATAAISFTIGGRGRHFAGVDDRIRALLKDADAQSPDHVLCTGDVTQIASELEFRRAAELFEGHTAKVTIIPGNHDRYTRDSVGRFERYFGMVAPPAYPFAKPIGDGALLVAIDAARPTSPWDSSGKLGAAQLAALGEILAGATDARFVILALHYGLFRSTGKPDRPSHGLRDRAGLLDVLRRAPRKPDLVLHGHMHRSYAIKVMGIPVYCAGSATDLGRPCGYHVFDIDTAARSFSVRRRAWDGKGYVEGPAPAPPVIDVPGR